MFGWALKQVDINNVFPNGDLNEETYMLQPPQILNIIMEINHWCASLRRRCMASNRHFGPDHLVASSFVLSKSNFSLFIRQSSEILLYVPVYVDDIISQEIISQLSYFLGIEVTHTASRLFLSQQKYIQDLLQHGKFQRHTYFHDIFLSPIDNESECMSIVGALQYIVFTRPDIMFAVNRVCQFMHKPIDHHFKVVKHILRFLQARIDHGVYFTTASRLSLVGYSYASWGNDPDGKRSTSSFCIFIGGNPVSWGSKKQQVVSRSSVEAEYKSLDHATVDITWLESLLGELSVQLAGKAALWCDNSSTVVVSANLILHSMFKHVTTKKLVVGHVLVQDQVADVLTKPLSAWCFTRFKTQFKVVSRLESLQSKR
ncbi:putative LRR receptor-like serine/threonine-protein kinase [Gossypium australe]|uniref:Putative LRR receptor-like serine/threonine-protein kinase n=1 Tax=Gossypium australe TaxID=47621 RepID=A0A5B6W8I0_9ROSI|nr:putative LRR receptor-like serine/threonine-protein kinase [Gossypium australe]